MKVAIMQPYFFPYIGYFKLLNEVDTFVFLDDVNYKKKGWINRNRILINSEPHFFSVPLNKPSQNKLISETFLSNSYAEWCNKTKKQIELSYKKSPYFKEALRLFNTVIQSESKSIAELSKNSVKFSAKYLNIMTNIIDSSSIFNNNDLRGQARIIDICKKLNATEYYNLPGGKTLYNDGSFERVGCSLKFINSNEIPYNSSSYNFISNLSILDVLANSSKDEISHQLIDQEQ